MLGWCGEVLTSIKSFEFFIEPSHILLELDALLLFVVVLGIHFQVNLGHFFVFNVEFVQLHHWVGLTVRVKSPISELVGFPMLLQTHFIAFFALS